MSDIFNHYCDAFDRMINGEGEGEVYEEYDPWRPKTCKFCGAMGLDWIKTENGWRLENIETREIHTCRNYIESKKR